MDLTNFSYAAAASRGASQDGWVSYLRSGWVWLHNKDTGRADCGWKVHLSVCPDQVEAAWDLIIERLRANRIQAKCAGPDFRQRFADPDHHQAGKMIVLRLGDGETLEEPEWWAGFLARIERDFCAAGIRPGPDVLNDRPLPGAAYCFYRNDANPYGGYASGTVAYNPHGHGGPLFDAWITAASHMRRCDPETNRRRLERVTAGWETLEHAGWGLRLSDVQRASDVARALTVSGVPAGRHGATLMVPRGASPLLGAHWHDAAELVRALDLGRALQDLARTHGLGDPALNARPRRSDREAPRLRLAGLDPASARALVHALIDHGCPAEAEDGVLRVWYGGGWHRGGFGDAWELFRQRASERLAEVTPPAAVVRAA